MCGLTSSIITGKASSPSTVYKLFGKWYPFSKKKKSCIICLSMYSSFIQAHTSTYIYLQYNTNTKMSMYDVYSTIQQLLNICNNECIDPSYPSTIKQSYMQVRKEKK